MNKWMNKLMNEWEVVFGGQFFNLIITQICSTYSELKVIAIEEWKMRFKLIQNKFLLSVLEIKTLSPPTGLERVLLWRKYDLPA